MLDETQKEGLFQLCKKFELEELKLQPSPFGGVIIGITGGGFTSTNKQMNLVSELRGKLLSHIELLNPNYPELDEIKEKLAKDKQIIKERQRFNEYVDRAKKTLPKVMKTCNIIIPNSFNDEQIKKAEQVE
jgi:hydroxymethylpyrimidine/phosphomethylpyrimidine kinase